VSRKPGADSVPAATARAHLAALRESARALVAPLAGLARRESRRRRLAWVATGALLVLVPLVINLARAPGFKASVELFPRPVAPYPPIADPGYYRRLLTDPELRRQMALKFAPGVAKYRDVSIDPDPATGTLVVSVTAATAVNAQRFVNALAPQIAVATQRQLGRQASQDATKDRTRLRTGLPRREQRTLRRRLRRLAQFGEFPPTRVLPGRPASPPRLDRWADRLVDDLPGDFPSRPNPVLAALAGLLVAATLWAICLALMPPGGRRSDAALPQLD
jgi:hypothetical protein